MTLFPNVETVYQATDITGEIAQETVVTVVSNRGVAIKQHLLTHNKKDRKEESLLISWDEWDMIVEKVKKYRDTACIR